MKCKTAEQWILRRIDGRLDARSEGLLAEHLGTCPACRKAELEYRTMVALLAGGRAEAPAAGFWERLEPRLREEQAILPLVFWERWILRAIPVFVALVVFAAGLFILTPVASEMTQSEALLLQNTNPLSETRNLFDEERPDNRNMMLIFASLDEKPQARRLP